MAIDVFSEEVIPLSMAARRLPSLRGKKPPHPFTLSRLETCRVGGTICTSIEALRRFFLRLDDLEPQPSVVQNEHRAKEAMERLYQKGTLRRPKTNVN